MALSKIDADGVSGLQETLTASTTVPSEGGAVTTNVVQGLAKLTINFNGTGTIATRESFNVSTIVDAGVGSTTLNITNAMDNANYTVSGTVGIGPVSQGWADLNLKDNVLVPTTSQFQVGTIGYTSWQDSTIVTVNNHGDLA